MPLGECQALLEAFLIFVAPDLNGMLQHSHLVIGKEITNMYLPNRSPGTDDQG